MKKIGDVLRDSAPDLGVGDVIKHVTIPSSQSVHHYTRTGQIMQLLDLPEIPADIGFVGRLLTLATMPHKDPGDLELYERVNGNFRLVMQRGIKTKLPYGSYPRLLLAWVYTTVVRERTKELHLGRTLSEFMGQLGLTPTGGRWGTIPRLREQINRLFSARVAILAETENARVLEQVQLARRLELWWDTKQPGQPMLWNSTVTLSEEFYQEILTNPVPVNLNVLKVLKRSPLGLDLYMFLTYRVSYLKTTAHIPWALLHKQFGAEYKRVRSFKEKAKRELDKIKAAWPELRLDHKSNTTAMIVYPSAPSVSKTKLAVTKALP